MSPLRDRRVAVLLVLVLIGSGLSVYLALSRPDADGAGSPPIPAATDGSRYVPADLVGPGGDALAAATEAVPTAFGFDHADLDGSLRSATAYMTTRYASTFTRAFRLNSRPLAQRRAGVAEGRVTGAGVIRTRDDTEVVCLVYLDQVLVEARGLARGQEPELLAHLRLRVDMVLRDGTWRVDGISTV